VTGALHSAAKDLHTSSSTGFIVHKSKLSAELQGTIKVQGKAVTYLPPDEPFTLLGVKFTALMDWGHQFRDALGKARHKAKKITQSHTAQWHKLYMIKNVLRPAITYPFVVAPYTGAQLDALDRVQTRAIKSAYMQRCSVGNALAREALRLGGMGATSLAVDYAKISAQTFTKALRSHAMIGPVSQATTKHQVTWMHGCTSTQHPLVARQANDLI
jgi:hypothetical protein